MLAWTRWKRQLCPLCGVPLVVHETDQVSDYGTGYLTCTATEAVTRARAAHDADLWGRLERKSVEKGGADPAAWRLWLHWPEAAGQPTLDTLD